MTNLPQKKCVVLGVDPGLQYAGYGILYVEGVRTVIVHDYGCLRLDHKKSISSRIGNIYAFFNSKIIEHQVTAIALETPFLGKNAQNFLKLGYVRGILYLLADQHHLSLYEFSPSQIKAAVTGYGGADKTQVATMVRRFFPALPSEVRADTTDALAVCLCAFWSQGRR